MCTAKANKRAGKLRVDTRRLIRAPGQTPQNGQGLLESLRCFRYGMVCVEITREFLQCPRLMERLEPRREAQHAIEGLTLLDRASRHLKDGHETLINTEQLIQTLVIGLSAFTDRA